MKNTSRDPKTLLEASCAADERSRTHGQPRLFTLLEASRAADERVRATREKFSASQTAYNASGVTYNVMHANGAGSVEYKIVDDAGNRPDGYALGTDPELDLVIAEIEMCEAEIEAARASAALGAALEAQPADESDEIAVACNPARLLADLEPLQAEATRREAEHAAAVQAVNARIAKAYAAHAAYDARRRAEKLPPPRPLPTVEALNGGLLAFGSTLPKPSGKTLLTELARMVDAPAPVVLPNKDRLAILRGKERALRAEVEAALQAEEQERKQAAEAPKAARKRELALAEMHRAENAVLAKPYNDARASNEKLADAHRARTAP